MSADIRDFHTAWWFLHYHPIFQSKGSYARSRFPEALEIDVVKVNPATLAIDDKPEKNTETRIWLETGPVRSIEDIRKECGENHREGEDLSDGVLSHDYELDVGGYTFELALVKLAGKVADKYGVYANENWPL